MNDDPCQQRNKEAQRLCRAIRAGAFAQDPDGFSRAVESLYALERAEERNTAVANYQAGKEQNESSTD